MRILLTGAAGQLGQQFLATARGHDILAVHHVHAPPGWQGPTAALDLTDAAAIEKVVRTFRPDWVVHGAAMTNVDACERDAASALRVNGHATGLLARAAHSVGARGVYVSTDYVFSGEAGAYKEGDATDPVQAYGKSKLEGERQALEADPDAAIARAAIVYGPHKANFVTWLVSELRAGRTVRIVDDQWVTPTHTLDLVEQILAILKSGGSGIYHTAGGEGMSRLEMAHRIADAFGLPKSLIMPIHASDLQWLARRPRDSRLSTSKIAKLKTPFSFDEALRILRTELPS